MRFAFVCPVHARATKAQTASVINVGPSGSTTWMLWWHWRRCFMGYLPVILQTWAWEHEYSAQSCSTITGLLAVGGLGSCTTLHIRSHMSAGCGLQSTRSDVHKCVKCDSIFSAPRLLSQLMPSR